MGANTVKKRSSAALRRWWKAGKETRREKWKQSDEGLQEEREWLKMHRESREKTVRKQREQRHACTGEECPPVLTLTD